MEGTRRPGQRAGLTRAVVLNAARGLLAEEGLDALTMRRVAARLAVAPNALYSHVAGKTQLLDDLLDDALAAVEEPAPDVGDPVEGLATLMTSTYEVLVARPDLVPLYLARQGARGANAVRLGEVMDALLARLGIAGTAAVEARRVLIVHVIGFAAFATGVPFPAEADRPIPAAESRRIFTRSLGWLLHGIVGAVATTVDAGAEPER